MIYNFARECGSVSPVRPRARARAERTWLKVYNAWQLISLGCGKRGDVREGCGIDAMRCSRTYVVVSSAMSLRSRAGQQKPLQWEGWYVQSDHREQ